MKKSIVILFFLLAQITLAQAAFSTSESQRFQTKINAEYADAATSPLLAEDLKDFLEPNGIFIASGSFLFN